MTRTVVRCISVLLPIRLYGIKKIKGDTTIRTRSCSLNIEIW